MSRWYTNYNEFIGALAIFLTATTAVAMEHNSDGLGPGKVGLALFSVFQASLPHYGPQIFTFSSLQQARRKEGKGGKFSRAPRRLLAIAQKY